MGGAAAGVSDQALKNAWRIERAFPKGSRQPQRPARSSYESPDSAGCGFGGPAGSARLLPGRLSPGWAGMKGVGVGGWPTRSSAPFPFGLDRHRRLAMRLGPRLLTATPLLDPAPRSPSRRCEVGGTPGEQTRRPKLGAARNALKRREERARERGRARGSGERERARAEAASGRARAGDGQEGAGRGAGEAGTGARALFRQVPTSLRGAAQSQRAFSGRKSVPLPAPLFPCYSFPIKKKKPNDKNSQQTCYPPDCPPPLPTPGTMKAAVDLKPTLTIIKTEKVDLELFPSPGEW